MADSHVSQRVRQRLWRQCPVFDAVFIRMGVSLPGKGTGVRNVALLPDGYGTGIDELQLIRLDGRIVNLQRRERNALGRGAQYGKSDYKTNR